MLMKKLLLSTFSFALIGLTASAQQDYQFSQFFSSPISYNPANAGAFEGDFRSTLNYRSQYGALSDQPFTTIAFAADAPIKLSKNAYDKNFLGVGLLVTNDNTGDISMNTFQVAGNVAYALDLGGTNNNPHFLSLGLQIGYMQRSQDLSKVVWENQWNGVGFNQGADSRENQQGKLTEGNVDVGGGISWYNSIQSNLKILLGASVLHANRPQVDVLGNNQALMTKFTGHASMAYAPENSQVTYLPNVFVMFQGPNRIIDVGSEIEFSLWDRTKFTDFRHNLSTNIGAYYRIQDALYFIGRVNYHDFSVGVSYDFTTSQLSEYNSGRGGVELVLSYRKSFSGPGTNRQKLIKSKGL